jgi:hypothetical protein
MSRFCVRLVPPHSRITTDDPSVVDSIAGTEVDTQFVDAAADGLAVSEVAQPDPVETGAHNTNRPAILQRCKPLRKRSRTAFAI